MTGNVFTFGSVCSGIDAASVAWNPLGWRAAFLSEIEKFPRAVLAHHYPEVPLHGDFTTIQADDYGPIDALVGGTPCQSFSLAGKRGGMADHRGNLSLEYILLARRKRARWVGWENVPGVLSSSRGDDFRCFLSGLVGWHVPLPDGGWKNSGIIAPGPVDGSYGVAWRILDAQYFGIPQRRRRVFVVGYLGDWRRAAAVLFERHGLRGHPPPRRNPRQGSTSHPGEAAQGGGGRRIEADPLAKTVLASTGQRNDPLTDNLLTERWPAEVAPTLNAAFGSKQGLEDQHAFGGAGLFVQSEPVIFASDGQAGAAFAEDVALTINATNEQPYISEPVAIQERAVCQNPEAGPGSKMGSGTILNRSAVRRVTPRECERLQGFPDDYTLIPAYARGSKKSDREEVARWIMRGDPEWTLEKALEWAGHPDGPRYKALGNSMAVPVMRWIGERIAAVEALNLGE